MKNDDIDFQRVVGSLSNIYRNWKSWSSKPLLSMLGKKKKAAVASEDEKTAKIIWCLETIVKIHAAYIDAFKKMKSNQFYEAWCLLEQAEIKLKFLRKHVDEKKNPFNIIFLDTQIKRFQDMYPYAVFFSPEIVEKEVQCSICNHIIKPRSRCGHMVGEIYSGQMCTRIVTKCQFISISVVKNPVQKYSVAFMTDEDGKGTVDHHDYSLVKFVSDRLVSPYHGWDYAKTTIRHPHSRFSHVPATEACPCESGKLYNECCLPTEGVLRPHFEILFEKAPPKHMSMLEYSIR